MEEDEKAAEEPAAAAEKAAREESMAIAASEDSAAVEEAAVEEGVVEEAAVEEGPNRMQIAAEARGTSAPPKETTPNQDEEEENSSAEVVEESEMVEESLAEADGMMVKGKMASKKLSNQEDQAEKPLAPAEAGEDTYIESAYFNDDGTRAVVHGLEGITDVRTATINAQGKFKKAENADERVIQIYNQILQEADVRERDKAKAEAEKKRLSDKVKAGWGSWKGKKQALPDQRPVVVQKDTAQHSDEIRPIKEWEEKETENEQEKEEEEDPEAVAAKAAAAKAEEELHASAQADVHVLDDTDEEDTEDLVPPICTQMPLDALFAVHFTLISLSCPPQAPTASQAPGWSRAKSDLRAHAKLDRTQQKGSQAWSNIKNAITQASRISRVATRIHKEKSRETRKEFAWKQVGNSHRPAITTPFRTILMGASNLIICRKT